VKRLAILGSTGSVGEQTLQVVAAAPDRFRAVSLAAGENIDKLADQVRRHRPALVSVATAAGADALREQLTGLERKGLEIAVGADGLDAVATHPADLVVAALVGAVGLRPTLSAIDAGRDVALANKEVMVMAGALVQRAAQRKGVTILPVDSEHSAIFQVLQGQRHVDVAKVILTCSGGPFRTASAEQIANATVEEALAHPNWDMGAKISIDSATLMNKALEVVEARWLFDVEPAQIDVVVHPQSIVHSLVEFVDRSVLAQLGLPDMRVPIAVALAHPERLTLDVPSLDLAALSRLDFEAPDRERFPALDLAFRSLESPASGGSEAAPAVLNAANEVTVARFLAGEIPLPRICEVNGLVLEEHLAARGGAVVEGLDDVIEADAWARARAGEHLTADAPKAAGAMP
jgi:1-deoxy-D-xylulose-5-phosphate reductoisomerase